MPHRARLADAAIRAACLSGRAGLAHADVDRLAGLPEGTTAQAFPTEADLVDLAANGLVAHDVRVWAAAGAALQWLAGVRLALEHGPLLEGRYDAICDGLTVMLSALGVPDARGRARVVMALIEGAVVHAVTVKRTDPLERATLADAFRRILS